MLPLHACTDRPSAWSRTSVNPITGRPSGSPVQNGVRSNGAGPVSQAKLPQTAANDVKPADKLSLVFAGLQVRLLGIAWYEQ
jgi:hypothetical protein